jgi:arylsulfatase
MVVTWPGHIKDAGSLRTQFLDVTDVAPTLLAAAGIASPRTVNGVEQKTMDGTSFLPALLDAGTGELRQTQYFEVFANRAIYHRGWFASALLNAEASRPDRSALDPDGVTWELYDLQHDFSQARNLATQEPGKLRELQDLWWAEAARNDVLPLDWRAGERLGGAGRSEAAQARKTFTYYPGMAAVPNSIAPRVNNRSWSVTATGEFAAQDHGMLVTQGGLVGGWAFYVEDDLLCFDYNFGLAAHYRITAPMPAGSTRLEARFAYDGKAGKPAGAGGMVTLLADGKALATGRVEKTLRAVFSMTDGMDVGLDTGSPVSNHYVPPFRFTGRLESVTIELD